MIDLETLSKTPGGVFFAIAALPFDPEAGTLGDPFFILVNPDSMAQAGFEIDASTEAWWARQPAEARVFLEQARAQGHELGAALDRLSAYLGGLGPRESLLVWGKGGDFDKPFLDEAYQRCDKTRPWGDRACRCYRTLEALSPTPVPKRTTTGVAHHALDDVYHQAEHAVGILRALSGRPALDAPLTRSASRAWIDESAPARRPAPADPARATVRPTRLFRPSPLFTAQ